MIEVRLEGSGIKDCLTTKRGWLNFCGWIDMMARPTMPLNQIWYLTHLRTFGWSGHLQVLENELLSVLSQDHLPQWVREILWPLAGVVKNRSEQDWQVQVVTT